MSVISFTIIFSSLLISGLLGLTCIFSFLFKIGKIYAFCFKLQVLILLIVWCIFDTILTKLLCNIELCVFLNFFYCNYLILLVFWLKIGCIKIGKFYLFLM